MVELTSIGQLPAWEQNVEFDTAAVIREVRHDPASITIGGNLPQDAVFLSAENFAHNGWPAHLHSQLQIRNPEHFVAGQLHDNVDMWQSILDVNDTNDKVQVENWIRNKVDIGRYLLILSKVKYPKELKTVHWAF